MNAYAWVTTAQRAQGASNIHIGKRKNFTSLCSSQKLTLEKAMKDPRWRRVTVLLFNLDARWGWVVNAKSLPLHPPGKRPSTHRIASWLGPRGGLDWCGKSSLRVAIPTELYRPTKYGFSSANTESQCDEKMPVSSRAPGYAAATEKLEAQDSTFSLVQYMTCKEEWEHLATSSVKEGLRCWLAVFTME